MLFFYNLLHYSNVYDTAANIDCSFEPQVEQFKTNFFRELNAAIEQKISKARATQNALSIVQTLDLQTRIKDLEVCIHTQFTYKHFLNSRLVRNFTFCSGVLVIMPLDFLWW